MKRSFVIGGIVAAAVVAEGDAPAPAPAAPTGGTSGY